MSGHTITAQAHPNIAFIKCTLAKLVRTNRKVRFRAGYITGGSAFCGENHDRTDCLNSQGQVWRYCSVVMGRHCNKYNSPSA
jgi:hypothetical protein